MKTILYIVSVFGALGCTFSQVIAITGNNSHNKPTVTKCDNTSNSVLIEHFFNIIFNEFHNTPPVCICVQMCPNLPTYCYPNGCLKKAEATKKPEVPQVIHVSEHSKPIFFLDENSDFINDFIDKNYVDENKAPVAAHTKFDSSVSTILRPDPFKDRYKIMFKYKKMPKVELKYNLGEQVKNMKSDGLKKENVDVSKTRWPLNKMNHYLNGQRMHSKTQENPKFFMSMYPDKDLANFPPKYFKRELADSTNIDEVGLDIKGVYVVGESPPETTTFSLENLIDSLVKSSFEANKTSNIITNKTEIQVENKNETKIESKIKNPTENETINKPESKTERTLENITEDTLENKTEDTLENKTEYTIENKSEYTLENKTEYKIENITEQQKNYGITETINNIGENTTSKQAIPERIFHNETTNVISMNSTNEDIDKNKYMKTNTEIMKTFSEMTAISKKIDIQNNTSLEMMRRMTSDINLAKLEINQAVGSKSMENIAIVTTDNTLSSIDYDSRTTKKSRQRLARRLQNSKNN